MEEPKKLPATPEGDKKTNKGLRKFKSEKRKRNTGDAGKGFKRKKDPLKEESGENIKWKKNKGKWAAVKVETKDGVKIEEYAADRGPVKRYPGRKKLDKGVRKKYHKGEGVDVTHVRKTRHVVMVKRLKKKENKIRIAEEETARAEVLLTERSGLMQTEEGTYTAHVTQKNIRDCVDITSAAKSFELNLTDFGPYKMQFTRNGRHLLLGGRKGHLASLDWITKKLHCEINVMESIHDVCWLHTEQMMAAAQKKWVYIYDNQGTELHCLKKLNEIYRLEYLPYHFLLCAGGESGHLSWLDVSLGKEMLTVFTKKGRLDVMRQNPYNAVICCGHSNGTVTMWTPNSQTPVASVLCHPQAVRCIEFDPSGRYFVTAGVDRRVKLWDARNLGDHIHMYRFDSGVSHLSFSQRNLLGVASGNIVEVYDKVTTGAMKKPYMYYSCNSAVTGLQFCPYEDVLGVSTYKGYCSLLTPGAGEPNFDALETNPYLSVSGRREAEVKALLGKVPHELITLDPCSIGQVDVPTFEEKLEAKKALKYVRVPDFNVKPRYRMKGKSGSAETFKRKQKTLELQKRIYLKDAMNKRNDLGLEENTDEKEIKGKSKGKGGLLDRFK